MNNIIRQRQLEASLALKMNKMSEKEGGEVKKTNDGYEWKNGSIIVKVKSF